MYSIPILAKKYIEYKIKSNNSKGHGTHSPFVFKFITSVLNDKRNFHAYEAIENHREELLKNNTEIEVEDFGAGSRKSLTKKRIVKKIAKTSLKPKKFGQLFFRMIHEFAFSNILELGTCLGITTAYLATANSKAKITTMEGASSIADLANSFFTKNDYQNIKLMVGNFDNTLPKFLQTSNSLDFVYIDGNHQYQPTIDYYTLLVPKLSATAVLIFDDIYWSKEMEMAWNFIKNDAKNCVTIDLFFVGMVFYSPNFKQKEHYTINF